ncbi:TRAP transporter large permease subunit [Roseisalinus antarcticus]|uniref:Sialic acid TRAP transporter permease protein SiaT n=1 Tax=Roseisalinus antarcticus TaxID=254357 RepID=A0A1Y5TDI0_9RHOB|nr:TRAP transporter large permease subunit [Roseisalinus antarcticus]SLN61729.1 Sialic acid TRAP transporter permease protein SiaT [Roseisalinus antarcticus]
MIDPAMLAAIYIGCLVGFSLLGLHVSAVMALLGVAGALLTFGAPVVMNIGDLAWSTSNNYLLVSMPIFVLMGELLLRSGITDRLYAALAAWMARLPGGLVHTNVFASAIFAVVMGRLYSGFATPTESAALGTVSAVVLAALRGRLTWAVLSAAFVSTVRITGIVTLLIVAAFFLNFILGLIGIPQAVAQWVEQTSGGPVATILLLVVLYLAMGCFMETLSMLITTVPIVAPIVAAQGIDPVWFGIFVVVMCELSLVTPPVGMNLYVVQGIREPGSDVRDVIFGVLPFIACMLSLIVLIMIFPGLVTWLPTVLFS